MSSFASLASLVVATADLLVVQDVIGAIRAADANERAANAGRIPPIPPSPAPASSTQTNHRECDSVCIRPTSDDARRVQLSPCYTPSRESHWVLPSHKTRLALEPESITASSAAASVHAKPSAIQPPWAQLPWQQPAKQIVRVKVVERHTDILTKGSLIDMFI